MAFNYVSEEQSLSIGNGATVSASFQLKKYATFIGLYLPAMDDGAVGLQVSRDNSTFVPVLDPNTGTDLIICASGSDPAFVDISDFIRAVPHSWYIQLTCAAQSSGAVTAYLTWRG